MKPILESWRRYLKEEFSEEEKQYFGKSLEIGDQIVQIFQDFLKNTVFPRKPQATIKDVQAYLPFFIEEVEAKTIAKKLGCGQFRCGFDVGAKEIIKVDVTPYGAGKEHNKDDHMMGTMIERSNIFPKAYAHSPDFSWVLLEKVKPFGRADVYTYVSYFPNPVLNARRTSDVTKYSVIISSFLYHAGFVEKAKTIMDTGLKDPRLLANLLSILDVAKKEVNTNYEKVTLSTIEGDLKKIIAFKLYGLPQVGSIGITGPAYLKNIAIGLFGGAMMGILFALGLRVSQRLRAEMKAPPAQ
jgi:hypothetical protein